MFAAVSTDWFIADSSGSQSWTSAEDLAFLNKQLTDYDVLIMGRKTFEANIDKFLTSNKVRIVRTTKPDTYKNKYPSAHVVFSKDSLIDIVSNYKDNKIALLGGSTVYIDAINLQLADTIYLTIEPIVLGSGTRFLSKGTDIHGYKLVDEELLGNAGTMLATYKKT